MVSRWAPVLVGQLPGSLEEAAQKGREYIEWTDQLAKDIDIPLVAQTVELQRRIFAIADDMGVGEEVRATVYAIRGAGYLGVAAQNMLGFDAAGLAATGLVTSLGAFGAIAAGGALVLVGSLLGGLFGDDSEDEKARRKKRRERIEKDLRDLLQPVTLSSLASEQDRIAIAWTPGSFAPPTPDQNARKSTALKLAAFFRAARAKLSIRERQMFESLLNIGRWGNALDIYSAMPPNARQNLSTIAYEGGWKYSGPSGLGGTLVPTSPIVDYGVRIKAQLDAALAKLGTARWTPSKGSIGTTLLVLAAAGAGAAYLAPQQTAAVVGAAKGAGARLWAGARRMIP